MYTWVRTRRDNAPLANEALLVKDPSDGKANKAGADDQRDPEPVQRPSLLALLATLEPIDEDFPEIEDPPPDDDIDLDFDD